MKLRQMVVMLATLALAVPLAAQMFGPRTPTLSGIWHPVVGTGAAYEITKDGKKSQMEIIIVGKEDVDAKPAFWLEMAMTDQRTSQPVYVKSLMSVSENTITSTRMVIQMSGQDPMEMDMNTNPMGRGMKQTTPVTIADKAEIVGTDTVTVPAGTFSCTHYRMKDGTGEAWVSDKVSPWGLVKSQDKDSSMVLAKVITDAKDHITGTPKKFDPMQMMRGMGQQGQQAQ
ncbi:MAG TPA: hypothetical protein VN976_18740 [Verrucomicrobiae bacterium]|nr:hypothetical protein [Verrucomicrobiae bacterium]